MGGPALWRSLAQRLDAFVDNRWAESVELHPWTGGQVSNPVGAGPDHSRPILTIQAVYLVPGAHATGEAGTRAAGMSSQQTTSEEWISIAEGNMGVLPPTNWRMFDRVYLADPERSEFPWHTVNYVVPSATMRWDVHLVRLNATILNGTGSPHNVVTPGASGVEYYDTQQRQFWRSTGYTPDTWVQL